MKRNYTQKKKDILLMQEEDENLHRISRKSLSIKISYIFGKLLLN